MKKFLTDEQVKMMNGNKKVKWDNESIKKALLIKIYGGKRTLDLVRDKCVPLPSEVTINRRIKDLEFSSGVIHFNIEILKAKCENLTNEERHFGLVFDEKAIVPGLELNNNTEHMQEQKQLASHGLVFMTMGVEPRIKQVVAFEFTGSSSCPRAMKVYIFDLIIKIENMANIFIDFLSLDISPVNCSFLKECGITLSKNSQEFFIVHPNDTQRKLYIKPDDVHNIKNMVSGIRKHRVKIAKCLVERFNLSSTYASFADIKKVHTAQKSSTYKFAPKLTQIVLKPTHYEIMREKNATRMFSADVSQAIDLLNEANHKKNSMSFLLETFQRFHEITCHANWSIENLEVYENDIAFLRFLIDDFFGNIAYENAYLKSVQAALMSIRSLISYSEYLFQCGLKTIKPSRLLSNAIENLFSLTTAKVSKPSALQFQMCLKSISIAGYELQAVSGSSYEWDEKSETNGIDFLAMLQNQMQKSILNDSLDDIEYIEILAVPEEIDYNIILKNNLEVAAFEKDMLSLSQSFVGTISCVDCRNLIILENNNLSLVILDFFKRLEYVFAKLTLNCSANDKNFEENFAANVENIHSMDHCFDVKLLISQKFLKYRQKLLLSSRNIHRANTFASKSLAK